MAQDSEIIIVSGLPRSGTSLMMQMLDRGGVEVVTDHLRTADTDNPRGYYELEAVKKLEQDTSWLPDARGKAIKIVSQLLYDLPANEKYRVIFMERDLDEILDSQDKMLSRRGQTAAPRERMKRAFTIHLEKLQCWLQQQPHMDVLHVSYNNLLEQPAQEAARVSAFLGCQVQGSVMAASIDRSLYRNRRPS